MKQKQKQKQKQKYYLHTSFAGSYYIPCIVHAELDDKVAIEYTDPILETKEYSWVSKEYIISKMPK